MKEIHRLIEKITREQCILFCASICNRMYPSYLVFYKDEKWGNPNDYADSIEFLYQNSLNPTGDVAHELRKIENIFPDLDEFDGYSASYAFDACGALHEAVNFVGDLNRQHVINCSTSATDTLDMFIQELLGIDLDAHALDETINSHTLMKNEINTQLNVLNYLSNSNLIDLNTVEYIRLMSEVNIVDLELLK